MSANPSLICQAIVSLLLILQIYDKLHLISLPLLQNTSSLHMESQSLLPPSSLPTAPNNPFTTPALSTRGICVRAMTIVLLLAISLWANYEASKGFDLTVNSASTNTHPGHRFHLMFVSNGKAAKMLLESSGTIEHILYPGNMYLQKPVRHVILELACEKTTEIVRVRRSYKKEKSGEYLILIKPEILEEENVTMAMAAALYRAMAYVWLWDGTTATQTSIVDSMVEYLMVRSGFDSMSSKNMNKSVGNIILKCEKLSDNFIARLNNAVHERMVDETLNQMLENQCSKHLQLASF